MSDQREGLQEQAPQSPNKAAVSAIVSPPGAPAVSTASDVSSSAAAENPAASFPADGAVPQNSIFIYALGQVQARFPSPAVEKEFAQVAGQAMTKGQTDRQVIASILSDRANRYLVREMCWVFVIEGLETYILVPRDSTDFELLVQAIRPEPSPLDIDVIIGARGPLAPPQICGGLGLPMVVMDHLYTFDRESLVAAIPVPESMRAADKERFRASARELLDQIMQMADNAGATDEHRALNYLAVRYPAIYARAAAEHEESSSLAAVEVRSSRLSTARSIVDVIFSYVNRQTDVTTKYFCRVDVTEKWPHMVTALSPYFDR
jgi:PatG C-terminal